ncbi:hypothetical protein BV20DRAFT_605276 [Pilatotrama ljubarskyi]|nr:hypothetical protein BV20DRAFT_605276 [Pilatotrama ljubarskyi]
MLAALQPSRPAAMSNYMDSQSGPAQTLLTEDRYCPGCKKSVVDENGGVVVAFGRVRDASTIRRLARLRFQRRRCLSETPLSPAPSPASGTYKSESGRVPLHTWEPSTLLGYTTASQSQTCM